LLWVRPVHGQPVSLYFPASRIALLVVLSYGQAQLYPGFGLGPVEVLRRYWLITDTAFLAMASLILALKLENSRVTLALGLSLASVPLLRAMTLRATRRWARWADPVTVVAGDVAYERILRVLRSSPTAEFRPAGRIDAGRVRRPTRLRPVPNGSHRAGTRGG
jgi:hypothetical protein